MRLRLLLRRGENMKTLAVFFIGLLFLAGCQLEAESLVTAEETDLATGVDELEELDQFFEEDLSFEEVEGSELE